MTAPKVLLVTQWYDPEPVVQPRWIAEALEGQGLAVEVLTGIPNYPDGRVPDGYRAWHARSDRVSGRPVYRTPLYPSHDSSGMRRMANYLSWALSASILGLRRLRRAAVSLVYSSPASAALPAMIAHRVFRVPYVLLVQDVWPDSVFASGLLPRHMAVLRWTLDRFVALSYRWASQIVVISPGMRELLVSRGVPADKVHVVYNWVQPAPVIDRQAQRSLARRRLGVDDDDFVMMYAGNHGAAQDLATVVEAVARVDGSRSIRLVMVGEGVEKEHLRRLAAERCPTRVSFHGQLTRDDLNELMAGADVHLVSLADDPLFAATTPSKLQSIMAAGYAVLANASGDVAAVVEQAGAGVAVPPGRPADLAHAIESLSDLASDRIAEFGINGSRFYEDQMGESVGAARLRGVLFAAAGIVNEDGIAKRASR